MYSVDGTKLREIAAAIADEVGDDTGFILIVFEKDKKKENSLTQYIANVDKPAIVRFLAECLTRVCKGTSFEPPTNN